MSTNARPIDVAIAAVTLLNSGPVQTTFGALTFTAKRAYRPTFDLKQHKAGLTVTVIPVLLNESPFSRQTVDGHVAVQVAVQDFVRDVVPATEDAACDALMLLVEQIKTVLENGLTLPEAAVDCGWVGTENDPIFFPDDLKDHGVFTSTPTFTYLTRRAR
jgi:hypothetical protein